MSEKWLQLGYIGKPHGLKGAFFVGRRSDDLSAEIKDVVVGETAAKGRKAEVVQQGAVGEYETMTLSIARDRTAAEALRGLPIWAARESLTTGQGEYLWSDLVGKTVVDNEGQVLGLVTEVANHGASDIVTVRDDRAQELALPFVDYYFAMGFDPLGHELRLVVAKATFADAWDSASC